MKKSTLLLISLLLIPQCLSTYSMDLQSKRPRKRRAKKRRQQQEHKEKKEFILSVRQILVNKFDDSIIHQDLKKICRKVYNKVTQEERSDLIKDLVRLKLRFLPASTTEKIIDYAKQAAQELGMGNLDGLLYSDEESDSDEEEESEGSDSEPEEVESGEND